MKAHRAKGHVKKHSKAATHKHHAKKAKHHPTAHQLHVLHMQHLGLVHAKAKHPAHAKAKALALVPGDVGWCVSEALGTSLRLQGLPVTDAAVLALHRAAGADDERGMPVRVALEAAAEYGLGGWRPVFAEQPGHLTAVAHAAIDEFGGEQVFGDLSEDLPELPPRVGTGFGQDLVGVQPAHLDALVDFPHHPLHSHGLILGVDLPGQHAVLATPDGWWSWGELWCPCEFPDAVIDEAWAVTWAVGA